MTVLKVIDRNFNYLVQKQREIICVQFNTSVAGKR